MSHAGTQQACRGGVANILVKKAKRFLSYLYEDLSIFFVTPEEHKTRAVEHAIAIKDFLLQQENAPDTIRVYGKINEGKIHPNDPKW